MTLVLTHPPDDHDGDHDWHTDDVHRARGETPAEESHQGAHREPAEKAQTVGPQPHAGVVPGSEPGGRAGGDDGVEQVDCSTMTTRI